MTDDCWQMIDADSGEHLSRWADADADSDSDTDADTDAHVHADADAGAVVTPSSNTRSYPCQMVWGSYSVNTNHYCDT